MQDLAETVTPGEARVVMARSKQAIARRSISSCAVATVELNHGSLIAVDVSRAGPPSASAQ